MIPPPRQHASCSSKVISASAAIANLLHRARTPCILEHTCHSWLWDVSKIQTRAAHPRAAWPWQIFGVFGSPCRKRTLFQVGSVDRRFAPCCAEVCWDRGTLQCDWTKHAHPKASAPRSKVSSSRDHARPLRLSFAHAMVLTMSARRFQRTHPLGGMGSSLNASKDFDVEVSDLALTCGSEPVMDTVCTGVVGSARTGRELDAGSAREDRSSDVCYAGDTR